MDQLEDILRNKRDEIQNDLPHDGHFERFDMRLQQMNRRSFPLRWIAYASSLAAVLVIGLLMFIPEPSQSAAFTLSDVSEQYAEVENYYTSSINKQIEKIKDKATENGKVNPTIQLLLDDLESYDQTYQQLCRDLEATPNDERVINALIVYYQSKLEIMTKILNELNQQRNNLPS
jgi:hypothetical protein